MRVLWIAGWYPNHTEPFIGDFVQRHARAVSAFVEVDVLFVTKDAAGHITGGKKIETYRHGSLTERKVYYQTGFDKIPVFGKLASFHRYQQLLKDQVRDLIRENGRPDLIHFYIGMKVGSIGKWIRQQGFRYIVSEQWTGFLEEGKPHFNDLPQLLRKSWRDLVANAAGIHVVSDHLARAVEKLADRKLPVRIIPNVVDTGLFHPGIVHRTAELKLVFVTNTLSYQKNSRDVLTAASLLKQKGIKFRLDIFGSLHADDKALLDQLGLHKEVIQQGEKPQQELAEFFSQADALIIYSRFETFGCVIIEANACGTPVIASDIAVLKENIRDRFNGIFARLDDPASLAEAIEWVGKNRDQFDREKIADKAMIGYNYERVGKMFVQWYGEVVDAR